MFPFSILPLARILDGEHEVFLVRTDNPFSMEILFVPLVCNKSGLFCFLKFSELMLESDINSKFVGNIEVGGLLLCKAPEEKMKSRSEHFQKMANNQMESVDNNYLRENDPRMPMLKPERNTRTTFGRN